MKKKTLLLIAAVGFAGLAPAQAATITGVKAVSRLPGSTPPFQASVTLEGGSVVGGEWGRHPQTGTWQADVQFTGTGGAGTRIVGFDQWVGPAVRSYDLEARAVKLSGGSATIEDLAGCSYSLSKSSVSLPAAGGVGSVSVTASGPSTDFCGWTLAKNAAWITILSPATLEGAGSGVVAFQVAANPCGGQRETTMVIAGMFFDVVQEADVPSVTLSPATRTHVAQASSGHRLTVQDPCSIGWSATTPTPWIHITAGGSGTGNGEVVYRLDANDTVRPRTGSIRVGTRSFTVIQEAIDCTIAVSDSVIPRVFTHEGGERCLSVSAPSSECGWSAVASCSWVSFPGDSTGSGSGPLCIEVAENLTTNERICAVHVFGGTGSQSYTVLQAAGPCQYGISPDPAFFEFPNKGGTGSVEVFAPSGCVWVVENEDPDWIEVTDIGSGEGDGAVTFSVAASTNLEVRTGTIEIKDQVVTIRQVPACTEPCAGEDITERRPVIQWCEVDGATWHQLHLNRNGKTFLSQWLEQATTSFTPDDPLPCGDYQWWVRSWGPDIGMGAWKTSCAFRIRDCCTPADLAGLAPDGTCEAGGRITYTWDSDPCASWYRLWVGRDGEAVHNTWYETGILPAGPVSRTVFDHGFGTYTWWIVGWGPDGMGSWTGPTTFSVGAAQPVAPLGAVASPVTITWNDACSAQAEWYQFWVNRGGQTYWHAWIPAGDTLPGGPDERVLEGMTLPAGTYTWWMRAWKPGGSGPWSDGTHFEVQ
jgi:hypothetical protein